MIIKVYKDGNAWGAFTGTCLADGECAFSDTPENAVRTLKQEYPKYKNADWIFCTGHDPKEQL